jgi:hypothetical protein
MTSVLPITTRNYHAKLVLNSGARVVLREVLFGEQVRLSSGKFAEQVTPMKNGRFRLLQVKNGLPAPIDLTAQHVDRIARKGGAGGLGPMPRPQPGDAGVLAIVQQNLPFEGTLQSFYGRAVIHGTDEKTGAERVILLSDVQVMEVKRRKPEPRVIAISAADSTDSEVPSAPLEERTAGDEGGSGCDEVEVEVTITAADLANNEPTGLETGPAVETIAPEWKEPG